LLLKGAFGRFSFGAMKHVKTLLHYRWLPVGFFLLELAGCSSGTLFSDVTRALYQQQFGPAIDQTLDAPLNPAYQYLRTELTGRPPALLVMGYVDPHPQGEIEVWYSAGKEVIKTQNGRIVGTSGLPLDWRHVRYVGSVPGWDVVNSAPQPVTRLRDEMPGYRYGVQSQLTVLASEGVPAIKLPQTLPMKMARRYRWYRESSAEDGAGALPASWFAVGAYQGQQTVVFSYQCLGADLCLSLQRWPAQKEPS